MIRAVASPLSPAVFNLLLRFERLERRLPFKLLPFGRRRGVHGAACLSFGRTPEHWLRFFGDWRYLFRLIAVVDAMGLVPILPATVVRVLHSSAYALALRRFVVEAVEAFPARATLLVAPLGGPSEVDADARVDVLLDGALSAHDERVRGRDYVRLPFGIHPRTYATTACTLLAARLASLEARPVRLLDSASHGDHYDRPVVLDAALTMGPSRNALLDALDAGLSEPERLNIDDPAQFYDEFVAGSHREPKLVSLRHGRPFSEWLFALAASDFFLCLPGRLSVLCHNVYEAMSVGCIPVLQYGHWFHPALRDGVDCFVYRDETDVCKAVRRALAAPPKQIAEMRERVRSYYREHLADIAVGRRISSAGSQPLLLVDTEWNTGDYTSDSVIFRR